MPAHALGAVVHRREGPDPAVLVNTRTPSVPHMTSGAEVTIVPSCAFIYPAARGAARAAPACASRATPASGRLGSGRGSAAARGPCDGPRPGTVSGPGQCEWPPAAARQCGRRPAARAITPLWAPQTSPPRVERRARPIPRSTHPLETIAPPRRRGGRSAHRRDLRVAKGRRHSAARAPPATAQSPSTARQCGAWRRSAASGSPACAFRPSSRPASARACHASRR